MKTILFVDGYNIIGNWEHLERIKRQSIAQARDQLLEELADYIAYTGYRAIVVFDAQFVQGKESESMYKKMKIVFTEENRIADEYIEAHARDYM
ncbi:NYN domain-containing protein, partial [Escherichia coli]|nr:NYN domain-containing protein [Escherichia coli]